MRKITTTDEQVKTIINLVNNHNGVVKAETNYIPGGRSLTLKHNGGLTNYRIKYDGSYEVGWEVK